MQIQIDKPQRYAKMRAHTATHLLHAEIANILPNTQQAGSYVDEDYLRFDFKSDKLLNHKDIKKLEENLNAYIHKSIDINVEEKSLKEAQEEGAKAFFEDKYGDIVRIVKIGDISAEFCGGTHVSNTREIGSFKIINQEAVASGIKRITAVTGPKTIEEIHKIEDTLESLATQLNVTTKQLPDKFSKIIKEYKEIQSNYESLQQKILSQSLTAAYNNATSNDFFDKIINIDLSDTLKTTNFKLITQEVKNINRDKTVLLYNKQGNYCMSSTAKDLKEYLQTNDIKGGGNNTFIQGRDQNILNLIK